VKTRQLVVLHGEVRAPALGARVVVRADGDVVRIILTAVDVAREVADLGDDYGTRRTPVANRRLG
jgi:hypothetical protein